ncbi:uncharacterized protein [Halyomorpha halys]|uniref:uncharacterized protein n=1 Tax=Halyomorpha halys TaxID=286706 RepID=UPI0034D1F827
MVICKTCSKAISRDEKMKISYITCLNIYHNKCIKLDSSEPDVHKKWMCAECESGPGMLKGNEPITMINLLKGLIEEVREMKAKLQGIDELEDFKDSLQKQSELSFENLERLEKIEALLDQQKNKIEELSLENNNLNAKISGLEARINQAEQNHLNNSVEIRGIPEKQGETIVGTVLSIGASLGVKLCPDDLDHAVRLRPKQERAPGSIVRFVRQTVRDELVRQRIAKRDFSTRHLGRDEHDAHRVYVSEAMTLANKHLYWLARQKQKVAKIKYVWFSGGRVRRQVQAVR